MARRTNKLIAEILTAIEGPSSSSNTNDNLLSSSLERKITLGVLLPFLHVFTALYVKAIDSNYQGALVS
jgi:hypothetical protein